jgi:multicomponent Na+:H+ antiporter subunit A
MAAPTPVSAYLHSATMVKAGIYLLFRMEHVLGDTLPWVWALTAVGCVTMVLGAVLALCTSDMKRILAYSTVMALGMLTVLIGLGFEESVKAAVVFLIVHSLYKATLFLTAGALDHEAGARDVTELSGLARAMPLTFAAALLAGLSMAGLPPLLGFAGKELTFEAKLGVRFGDVVLPVAAVVANALTVAAAAVVVLRPFLGARRPARGVGEASLLMWSGPLLLGIAGLVLGVVPSLFSKQLVEAALQAVGGEPLHEVHLSPWPGPKPALALSVASWSIGAVVFWRWDGVRDGIGRVVAATARFGAERAIQAIGDAALSLARATTRTLVHGRLPAYMALAVGTVVLLVGGAAVVQLDVARPSLGGTSVAAWALAAVVLACYGLAALTPSRVVALAAVAGAGVGVAGLFAMVGAPDLAVTQLMVDTLIPVVLLLMAPLLGLRGEGPRQGVGARVVGAGLALALGVTVTVVLLAVIALPLDRTVAQAYSDHAVPWGHGHNVVNVILVEFRALDTLGEITVVVVAALGVWAVLRGRHGRRAP